MASGWLANISGEISQKPLAAQICTEVKQQEVVNPPVPI